MDYRVIAQGKTSIPNVDDGDEFEMTDVRQSSFYCFAFYVLTSSLRKNKNKNKHPKQTV